ncbi:MAG: hypothetical protein RI985_710 [Chloroflexota bacterium]|jgi:hypothetical protein
MGRMLLNLLWKVFPWLLIIVLLTRPTLDMTTALGQFLESWTPAPSTPMIPLNPSASNPATQMIDEQTVVRQVRDISRLETQSVLIDTTFKLTNNEASTIGAWWDGELLQMRAVGTVIAGVDLNDMSVNDITVSENGRKVTMSLAEVKILAMTLDQAQTQPLSYEKGLGLVFKSGIDMTEQAYAVAHDNILREACEARIMDNAAKNAIAQLTQLIKALNPTVQTVEITVQTSNCLDVAR